MDYSNNQTLQTVCDVKQPVLLQMNHLEEMQPFFNNIQNTTSSLVDKQEVNLYDIREYQKGPDLSVDPFELSFSSAKGLIDSDPKGNFFSQNNFEFGKQVYGSDFHDSLVKPFSTIKTKYDFLFGSKDAATPLQYHTDSRRYLFVSEGAGIHVKMTPWKSTKYLHPNHDYEHYEFWSPINLWNKDHPCNVKYREDIQKIKCLEFDVPAGYMLYVPPFWWYSIQFMDNSVNMKSVSNIACITFITSMNLVSNIPNYLLYLLQQQNIRHIVPKVNTNIIFGGSSENNNNTSSSSEEEEKIEQDQKIVVEPKTEVEQMLSVLQQKKE